MNGAIRYPCRAGEDAPLAGLVGQPGTANGRRLASGPWQSPSFRSSRAARNGTGPGAAPGGR